MHSVTVHLHNKIGKFLDDLCNNNNNNNEKFAKMQVTQVCFLRSC